MTDDRAWTEEELFWISGEEHYRKMLDDECIMVFPAPAGIIAGPDIALSLKNAPRWRLIQHQQTPAYIAVIFPERGHGARDAPAHEPRCQPRGRPPATTWSGPRWPKANLQPKESAMARCETCGNDYDKAFQVTKQGKVHVFDSFECAIHALAPVCPACGIRILGH